MSFMFISTIIASNSSLCSENMDMATDSNSIVVTERRTYYTILLEGQIRFCWEITLKIR